MGNQTVIEIIEFFIGMSYNENTCEVRDIMEPSDTTQIGFTFQMSLDAFLEEEHPIKTTDSDTYDRALKILEEAYRYRSNQKKCEIAKTAIQICKDCIEAYLMYGMYSRDIYEKMSVLRYGMELAVMNIGKEFFLRNLEDFYEEDIAKPLLRIKYAYAVSLYEAGNVIKAQKQFQEILNLNPSDVFNVKHYLYATYLYFEQNEKCRQMLAKEEQMDAFLIYTDFFLLLKEEQTEHAVQQIPMIQKANSHLYDMITYRSMNTTAAYYHPIPGSFEEAAYIYKILSKVILTMEHLPIFLIDHEN